MNERNFREAIRKFATDVTVVTTKTGLNVEDGDLLLFFSGIYAEMVTSEKRMLL